jgi:hypothetical protein
MMRRLLLLGLALSGSAALAQPGGAPDPGSGRELPEGSANLDFILVNRTGRTIVDVQITPSGEGSGWSDDILVQREVPNVERAAASYTRDIELCRWDVRATFEGGAQRVWPRIDLCNTVRVELR